MTTKRRARAPGTVRRQVTTVSVPRVASKCMLDRFTTRCTRNGNSTVLVESMARLETAEPGSCPFYTCCEYNDVNRVYDCGGMWIDGGMPCIGFVERLDAELAAIGQGKK